MKGNKIVKIVFLTIFILYFALYITQALGYYEYQNKKTNTLTEEAAKRFEQDIKAGKTVKASDYIKKENDYNNNLSRMGMGLSNVVGNIFDSIMTFVFGRIDKTINN